MEQSPPPPKPKVIFDEPEQHWDFLMLPSDADFEGQHFERKEACRARTDGEVSRSDIRRLEANAARLRAERTQALVEELADTVFPLPVGVGHLVISTKPVGLSQRGDGEGSLRVDGLIEPEVEFSMHRAGADIREGIVRYGSFEHQPKDIELVPVCANDQIENMRSLIEKVEGRQV
jgi:hypothetical protein